MKLRNKSSKGVSLLTTLLLIIVAVVVIGGYILFFEGDKPIISLDQTGEYIGKDGRLTYLVSDNTSGIRSVTVWLEQGGKTKQLHHAEQPRTSYSGAIGPQEVKETIRFSIDEVGFEDGPMIIGVQARDFSLRGWLKGNSTRVVKEVTVDTVPPRIEILHSEKYITPGGTGIAIYRLSDSESRHGVYLNNRFNPGFLLGDGRDDTFISFFGLPYDTEKIEQLHIGATDRAGNMAQVAFATVVKQAHFKQDTINVGDSFLQRKIPEFEQYYPEMTGDLLDKYLFANQQIRQKNNEAISSLCNNPQPERLWQGSFLRMAGSSRAGFADHRTYLYGDKIIDHQVHLGMDIASTKRADVKAANTGKVVFADYLGIYGNMIVLDHGQGLFSLYSHLSQLLVNVGDMVNKGDVIGLTGTTGMAGGDHLHFSLLVNGVFVTPKEWWDDHWIAVTIDEPITDSKF